MRRETDWFSDGKVARSNAAGAQPNGALVLLRQVDAATAAGPSGDHFNKELSEERPAATIYQNGSVGTPFLPLSPRRAASLRSCQSNKPPLTISPFAATGAASDVLASFSSRGPSTIEGLKPDITAPGDFIYSGAITSANCFGVFDPSGFLAISGTSQAAPHVAGAAALIKQLNSGFTQSNQVRFDVPLRRRFHRHDKTGEHRC